MGKIRILIISQEIRKILFALWVQSAFRVGIEERRRPSLEALCGGRRRGGGSSGRVVGAVVVGVVGVGVQVARVRRRSQPEGGCNE